MHLHQLLQLRPSGAFNAALCLCLRIVCFPWHSCCGLVVDDLSRTSLFTTGGRWHGTDLPAMVWLPRRSNCACVWRSRCGLGFSICCCSAALVVASICWFLHNECVLFLKLYAYFVSHALQLMVHTIFVCCICGMILLRSAECMIKVVFASVPAAAFFPCSMSSTPFTLLG